MFLDHTDTNIKTKQNLQMVQFSDRECKKDTVQGLLQKAAANVYVCVDIKRFFCSQE